LIDFNITNEELAKFCGINSASSINRMLRKLKEMNSIKIVNNKILIKDVSIIESFVA
jgi:DNA-binding transcriptional regulator LsrR (DeoR family)